MDYKTYTINQHVSARIASRRPWNTYWLELTMDWPTVSQTFYFINQYLTVRGWKLEVNVPPFVPGDGEPQRRVVYFVKSGSGPWGSWKDLERDENLRQLLTAMEENNIGPVPVVNLEDEVM